MATGDPALSGLETAAQQLARDAAQAGPVTLASVALWDQPSFALRVRAVSASRALHRPLPLGAWVPLSRAHWHRQVFEGGKPLFVERAPGSNGHFDDEAGLSLIGDLQSVYLLPIHAGDETVGVLSLGEMRSRERQPFSEERRERCRIVLDQFLAASAEAWEAARLRRQARAMSSLLAAIPQLLEARSFEDVLACCASEVAGWLGAPVRGLLLRTRSRGGMEIAACWRIDRSRLDDVTSLVMALTRPTRVGHTPVSVVTVADDPLDPVHAAFGPAETLTRVAMPLLQGGSLLGVVCLYVEDELRLTDWEIDAFRRRGEVAALGMGLVQVLEAQSAEGAWMARATYDLLTMHQRAVVAQTLLGARERLVMVLPERLGRVAADLGAPADGEVLGRALAGEAVQALDDLHVPDGHEEDLPALHVDMNAMVRRAVDVAEMRLDHGPRRRGLVIDIRFEPASGPLIAEASPGLIGSLVHAIDDAIDAMPDGGSIRIRTARDDGHVLGVVESTAWPRDGLAQDVAGPPVVATPGLGRLGLSVLRAVTRRHGGSVSRQPGEHGGTVVEIRLPAATASGGPIAAGLSEPDPRAWRMRA